MKAPPESEPIVRERFPSEELLRTLRASISGYLARVISEDEVCVTIERMADEARSAEVRAERMLIALKAEWRVLADASGISTRDQNAMLSRLTALCIDRYYRER